eukprot:Gb_16486 [translate_table: standard]
MQASVQSGGRSASPLSRSKSTSEYPPSPAYSASGRTRKRDRSSRSVDSSKGQHSSKLQDINSLLDKDGGLLNCAGADHLYFLMQQDLNKNSRRFTELASRRKSLAAVLAATVRDDCLNKFVRLGGLPLLDDWLRDAHKGKLGDGESSKEDNRSIDDLILTLLQALEKLPVDLDALKSCNIGRSVKTLRTHKNSRIQKKARNLVDTWKKRVDAEIMRQSEETITGPKQDMTRTGKPMMPKDSTSLLKNGPSVEGNVRSSGTFGSASKKTTTINSSSLGEVAIPSKKSGTALSSSGASTKDSTTNMHSSNNGLAEIDGPSVQDERSCNSSQPLNNGVPLSSGQTKIAVSNWKEEFKGTVNNPANTKPGTSRSHISSKGILGAGLNGVTKEAGSGKALIRSMSAASIEKKGTMSAALDKTSNESLKAEACSNNQRLILRLPNTARSPTSNSVAAAIAPTLDSNDRKNRSQTTCIENASIKPAASGHENVEKHVDLPERRNEMECHSSESHLSFSSAECCTVDFKKSNSHMEAQHMDDRTHESLLQTGEKSNGCGTDDINVGISLLASIAADENLRIEKNAASTSFEGKNNSKGGESQHQELKTCLTDSENSPLSGVTENSGRTEVVPDPDVKDAQGTPECHNLGSGDGIQNMGIAAESIDVDPGQSDENMRPSKGQSLEQRSFEKRFEASNNLPANGRKSSDSQNATATSTVKSLDDNSSKENEVVPGTMKDCTPLEETVLEDKKNSLVHAKNKVAISMDVSSPFGGKCGKSDEEERDNENSLVRSKSNYATSMDISSAAVGGFDESGGEERDEKKVCSTDIVMESALRFPGEDALEVAMQVAKEVDQEMENYGKVSQERENNMEENSSYKKVLLPIDHPTSKFAGEHLLKSTELLDKEMHDASNQESFRGMDSMLFKPKEEILGCIENKETFQSVAYSSSNDRKQTSSGIEGLDELLGKPSGPNKLNKPKHAEDLQHAAPSVDKLQETAEVELSAQAEAPGKLDFDLNEGIPADESPDMTTTTVSYRIASIPITPVASHPVTSSSLDNFIPPVSPFWGKGELGWKGSAATSAFRPAEPRKTQETCQTATETTAAVLLSASTLKVGRPFLDFDLNIADEGMIPEAGSHMHNHRQNTSGSRPDLDLNRVDENEETPAVLTSETIKNEGCSLSSRSKAIKHDFDLNDVLNMDDTAAADPIDYNRNSGVPGYAGLPHAGFKMGSEMNNHLPAWRQAGSVFPLPPFASVRQEAPFSGPAPHAFFSVGQGECNPPFHPDLPSSAVALPYPTPAPPTFPYAGYQFGFSSTSFPAGSASFLDSASSASYPPMASHFLSSGAALPSHSRPPYLMGFTEIGAAANTSGMWTKPSFDLNAGPSLDLNAGPDLTDADAREERAIVRRAPVFGNHFPLEEQLRSFRQSAEAADCLKRKEPEGGWDVYRAGLKQAMWR